MAENAPPPMVRHLIWGKAPQAHAETFHAAAPRMSMPKLNSGELSRGMAAGRSDAAGAGGGSSSRRLAGGGMDAFNDPVVTGMGYEQKTPGHGGILAQALFGGPTDTGKQQETLHGRYQQAMQAYQQALDGGASQQQALAQVVRADPGFLSDVLVSHPAALKAFQTAGDIHDFMAGKQAEPIFGNFDAKTGQQPMFDAATGKVTGVNKVADWQTAPTPARNQQVIQTANGPMVLGPNAQATPITGPDGNPVAGKPTAGKAPPGTFLGIGGVPQLSPQNMPKGGEDRITMEQLQKGPTVMREMQNLYNAASTAGLLTGPLKIVGGQYIGANGQAINFKTALDAIGRALPGAQGTNYKASLEIAQKAIADPNEAPTFIRQQIPTVLNDMRAELQAKADTVTQQRQAGLPDTVASPLMKDAGVVPNGWQDEKLMAQAGMSPANIALWKAQVRPTAMNDQDYSQLYRQARSGAYGPLPKPGNDPKQTVMTPNAQLVLGLLDKEGQQAQNVAAGAAASSSAAAANAQPPRVSPRAAETPQAQEQQSEQGNMIAGGGSDLTQQSSQDTEEQDEQQQQQQQQAPVPGAMAAPSAVTPQQQAAVPSPPNQSPAQANTPTDAKPNWVNALESSIQNAAQGAPQAAPGPEQGDVSPYAPPPM